MGGHPISCPRQSCPAALFTSTTFLPLLLTFISHTSIICSYPLDRDCKLFHSFKFQLNKTVFSPLRSCSLTKFFSLKSCGLHKHCAANHCSPRFTSATNFTHLEVITAFLIKHHIKSFTNVQPIRCVENSPASGFQCGMTIFVNSISLMKKEFIQNVPNFHFHFSFHNFLGKSLSALQHEISVFFFFFKHDF